MVDVISETARFPFSDYEVAGGQASSGEVLSAAVDQMVFAGNEVSRLDSLSAAYSRRIRSIEQATGVRLDNPLNQSEEAVKSHSTMSFLRAVPEKRKTFADYENEFQTRLAELAEKYPAHAAIIKAGTPLHEDAAALARDAEERAQRLFGTRQDVSGWAAYLAGGLIGSLRSPTALATSVLGAGPGTARTIAGRIAQVAGREALLNAGAETAIQPAVQAWRDQIGLDAGLSEALKDIALAGTFGGILGGAIQGGGEAIRLALRGSRTETAIEAVAADPAVPQPVRDLAEGNAAAPQHLSAIRDELEPVVRGALDEEERIRLSDDQRPPTIGADTHDTNLASAEAAAIYPDEAFRYEVDPAQIERVVADIAGPHIKADSSAGELTDFLIRAGGVSDIEGELAALGLQDVSVPFTGRLVKPNGRDLDQARELAAEAGFFDAKYGDPETAANQSTPSDLLDILDEESRADIARTAEASAAAESAAQVESVAHQIAELAGPDLSNAELRAAIDLVSAEGLDPADALERLAIMDEPGSGITIPGEGSGRIAANGEDINGGLDDPFNAPDDYYDWESELNDLPDDFNIPFFGEDEPVRAGDLKASMERTEQFEHLIEACAV